MSLIGGVLGAVLLLHTPEHAFTRLIPWLLLVATLLFTFGGLLTTPIRERMARSQSPGWVMMAGICALQFVISIYGGYFGAGIGILMLATLALMGEDNIHEMNALKALLATLINGVAVITFVLARAIYWPEGVLMVGGAIAGGYGGAWYARRVKQSYVRAAVMLTGFGMTLYFFLK
jgi:uncharacterized membrane protein YfcA